MLEGFSKRYLNQKEIIGGGKGNNKEKGKEEKKEVTLNNGDG